ncbi:MAG: hypothetical protein K5675_06700 [Lachnospiraceae bacterium]|nr:hypothetical protein [Lachnospiraceae bacterium]
MKKSKKILAAIMAVLSLSMIIPTISPVEAASSKVYINYTQSYDSTTGTTVYKSGSKKLLFSTFDEVSCRVYEEGTGAKIKNLKVNKSGLKAKVTNTNSNVYSDSTYGTSSRFSTITLYAKKTGTYKVTFKINSKSYTLTCKVVTSTNAFSKATFGSQEVSSRVITDGSNGYTSVITSNNKVSGSKGKFKVTANSDAGYKVTGLVVLSANKKGKATFKSVKNGRSITLSKAKLKYTSDDGYTTYTDAKKYTYVYVSYKNSTTGESVKYSIGKDPTTNQKAIKCVYKDNSGQTYTSYYTNGSGSDYEIWN